MIKPALSELKILSNSKHWEYFAFMSKLKGITQ